MRGSVPTTRATCGYCIDQANDDNDANTIVLRSDLVRRLPTITLGSGLLQLTTPSERRRSLAGRGGDRQRRRAEPVFQVDPVSRLDFGTDDHRRRHPSNGGGLYNDGGNVTLTNCTVSGNSAASYAAARPVQLWRHGHADQLSPQRQLRRRGGGGLYDRGTPR